MPAVILDACGTVNLYASGKFVPILSALRHDWYIPLAVERESLQYRQPDPKDEARLIVQPLDLALAISAGLLKRCDCEGDDESALYVSLAAQIGDDGESMGIAIAKHRGWSVLTDDKKARRIATGLGVAVVATTEVMKQWSVIANPSPEEIAIALSAIERFANFRPGPKAVEYAWWQKAINPSSSG